MALKIVEPNDAIGHATQASPDHVEMHDDNPDEGVVYPLLREGAQSVFRRESQIPLPTDEQ